MTRSNSSISEHSAAEATIPDAVTAQSATSHLELSKKVAILLEEKQLENIVILDLENQGAVTNYFVISTAQNSRQAAAAAMHVKDSIKSSLGIRPLSINGLDTGTWILLDFGGLFVHIFQGPTRDYFKLEQLWSKAKHIKYEANLT